MKKQNKNKKKYESKLKTKRKAKKANDSNATRRKKKARKQTQNKKKNKKQTNKQQQIIHKKWVFWRDSAPAQRAAGGCSPLKATPGRGPAAGEKKKKETSKRSFFTIC